MIRPVRLVCATRHTQTEFWARTYLGRSLMVMPASLRPAEIHVTYVNRDESTQGLSALYNQAIASCPLDRYLVFVHDDVYLHDPFLTQRVAEGLCAADVMGLAGSRNSDLSQPSWGLAFNRQLDAVGWQSGPRLVLSGAVSHSDAGLDPPRIQMSVYGPVQAPCDLLDGLFLACRPERLIDEGVRFDEMFRFHLYDLDFCRSARKAGLRLCTWPLLVTHASGGNFASPEWKAAARCYLAKWQDDGKSGGRTLTEVSHLPRAG